MRGVLITIDPPESSADQERLVALIHALGRVEQVSACSWIVVGQSLTAERVLAAAEPLIPVGSRAFTVEITGCEAAWRRMSDAVAA